MRPPPKSLPAATSRKWRNRRLWDPLGYIRVRTLSNPAWRRDAAWLTRVVTWHRPTEPGRRRDLIDEVINELGRYRSLRPRGAEPAADFAQRSERQWDIMLARLDAYLEAVQAEHLRAVEEAGRSGGSTHRGEGPVAADRPDRTLHS